MSVTSLVPTWEGYTSSGVQVITPMRESWGKGITYGGPLLTINLGISHVLLNWLTSPGAQKWLRTSGQARCLTNQITLGKCICHRREGTCLLAGSSESLHGSMEGTFHLRKSQGPWDTWVGCVPILHLFIVLYFLQSTSHPLKWSNLFLCSLSFYSEEQQLQEGRDFACMVEGLSVMTLELGCLD